VPVAIEQNMFNDLLSAIAFKMSPTEPIIIANYRY
jgi:hypothetical protein